MLVGYNDSTLPYDRSAAARKRTNRFADADVAAQLARGGANIHRVYGRAGTAVVFETSSVHRGMPCACARRGSNARACSECQTSAR
jgi:hypothetical protein